MVHYRTQDVLSAKFNYPFSEHPRKALLVRVGVSKAKHVRRHTAVLCGGWGGDEDVARSPDDAISAAEALPPKLHHLDSYCIQMRCDNK